jgi:selenocysteine lyase/cysteine desulfurase
VWGLEAAVDLISSVGTARIERHLLDLTARLIEGVLARGYIVLSSRHEGERSGVVSFPAPDPQLGEDSAAPAGGAH